MSDPPRPPSDPGPPEYNVYRSRRGAPSRLSGRGDLDALRKRLSRFRDREPREPRGPKAPLWRRILKWVAIAAGAWLLLSFVLFMVSSQITEGVSDETEDALASGGSLLTGSTILVLGSDERPEGSLEPGAGASPARADSIMLLHVSFGSVRKLSILRDSPAAIPGHGTQKINAAYAFGGAPLMIETVESFLGNGIEVNHIIEVSFEDFPDFIDALGGVDVNVEQQLRSNSFGGKRLRLSKGEHHLDGDKALRFARVRENELNPSEDDRTRAARQQQVMSAIRSQLLSPSTFFRLPLVSWEAPRTIRSDMKGPGLLALFTDLLTGGTGKTRVLECLPCTEEEKAEAVDQLLG